MILQCGFANLLLLLILLLLLLGVVMVLHKSFFSLILPILILNYPCYGMDEEQAGEKKSINSGAKEYQTGTKFDKKLENILNSYKGMTPEKIKEVQLNSKDWFIRNNARFTIAQQIMKKSPGEADALVRAAFKEEFAAASFALLQEGIREKNHKKSQDLFRLTCDYLVKKSAELDDQGCDLLVSNLRKLSLGNAEFKNILTDFQAHELFKEVEKPKANNSMSEESANKIKTFKETVLMKATDGFDMSETSSLELKINKDSDESPSDEDLNDLDWGSDFE